MTPAFDIIDPHIHLWDPYSTPRLVSPLVRLLGRFPKTLDKVARLLMPKSAVDFVGLSDYVLNAHLPHIYHHDTGKYNIKGYVHIQAGWVSKRPTDVAQETAWLNAMDTKPLAIVGEAHLHDLKNLNAVLDTHQAASPLFKGVRDMLACHDSRKIMDFNEKGRVMPRDDFRKGYQRLGKRNLTYDAFLYSYQLKDFIDLATAIPATKVVLDHIGTPIGLVNPVGGVGKTTKERAKIKAEWYEDLASVATIDHVQLKLSGLFMPIVGFNYHLRKTPPSLNEVVDAIAPHVEFALKQFGVERCMFASNFPMDKVSLSFEMLYDAYFKIVENYSEADQRKLFYDNALAFYGINI